MIAVILAGGKGTRIASLHADIPKPMIPLGGVPVLERQLCCLRGQGVKKVILVTGHMHEIIENHFGNGMWQDIQLSYIVEEKPLGTAGALYYLQERLQEDFLLLNGDLLFEVDLWRFWEAHVRTLENGGIATILTHPNSHPYDSALIQTNKEDRVVGWLHREDKRQWYCNRVNAGIHLFSPKLFSWLRAQGLLANAKFLDLDREVLRPMIPDGLLYAYNSPEYVKDVGTPERCREAEEDLQRNRLRSLSQLQRAVFLDRDGTVNEEVGFLHSIEQFQLLPGVAKAIALLNKIGWLVIVVTNQPTIARGEMTLEELETVHCKMETLLGQMGAYVDGVYFCPHHPDKGFFGERPEYKIECTCRKPKPGMLLKAAERFHINLASSWMVGDNERDMKAGEAAGCHTAGLYGCVGERSFYDLLEFAQFLQGKEGIGDEAGTAS
ncbi:MAG: D-glycero-beta-D-manno-heptose 1,7-bisphosphate 7-phosphatase [Clostridium sp.]|nr:D-glycero-beta-D-manno-heptose 1,7-bisphosphate 7-phosphatase [Clostridium sp.]